MWGGICNLKCNESERLKGKAGKNKSKLPRGANSRPPGSRFTTHDPLFRPQFSFPSRFPLATRLLICEICCRFLMFFVGLLCFSPSCRTSFATVGGIICQLLEYAKSCRCMCKYIHHTGNNVGQFNLRIKEKC